MEHAITALGTGWDGLYDILILPVQARRMNKPE
jgi:hypothetical protein